MDFGHEPRDLGPEARVELGYGEQLLEHGQVHADSHRPGPDRHACPRQHHCRGSPGVEVARCVGVRHGFEQALLDGGEVVIAEVADPRLQFEPRPVSDVGWRVRKQHVVEEAGGHAPRGEPERLVPGNQAEAGEPFAVDT